MKQLPKEGVCNTPLQRMVFVGAYCIRLYASTLTRESGLPLW
ncbi:hypothetical protein SAMN05660964_00523 [Thiothrix caldifontis]|uniref:Uncharacterized protein n=1 Tax=Thiothrix caldifontis TaxID=525918 RepID=A0A1H3WNK7_9GAMM|nr:hypothetical protein SAMN05660964_00523 [Thiothrix caldifontis]